VSNSKKPLPLKKINVLDKGFVTLVDHMGSDLTTVNAARISFGKHKDSFEEADEKLIKYLAEHEHTSPFRHSHLTFHVKAPIFVLRQWMKHKIASEFNEISGRYTEFASDEFYLPETFRQQAKVNKQGSEGVVEDNTKAQLIYSRACKNALIEYKKLLDLGVCREQARGILPVGMYSEVYWTVSLQAVAYFIHLRKDGHAQWEIQQYAEAVEQFVKDLFPISYKHLIANM
jgi:thymidylate synthase (FAD)